MSHRTRTVVLGRVGTWVPLVNLDGDSSTTARNARHMRVQRRGGHPHRAVAVSDLDTDHLARRVDTHCRIDPYLCIAGDLHAGACVPIF